MIYCKQTVRLDFQRTAFCRPLLSRIPVTFRLRFGILTLCGHSRICVSALLRPVAAIAFALLLPLPALLLQRRRFLRREFRLRHRHVELSDEIQKDFHFLRPLPGRAVGLVDNNLIHKLKNHRRGQFGEIRILPGKRHELVNANGIRVKSVEFRLSLGDGFLQRRLFLFILGGQQFKPLLRQLLRGIRLVELLNQAVKLRRPFPVTIEFPRQVFGGLFLPYLGRGADFLDKLLLIGNRVCADCGFITK